MMSANVRGPVLQLARLADRLDDGASVVPLVDRDLRGVGSGERLRLDQRCPGRGGARLGEHLGRPRHPRQHADPGRDQHGVFAISCPPQARERFEHEVVGRVPLGRTGPAEEEETAAVALFPLCDEPSYVTASQYAVDGGLTKR